MEATIRFIVVGTVGIFFLGALLVLGRLWGYTFSGEPVVSSSHRDLLRNEAVLGASQESSLVGEEEE